MFSGETRKAILYIFGIGILIIVLYFIVTRISESGFGALNNDPNKTYSAPPEFRLDLTKSYTAVINTSMGEIKYQLLAKNAPIAVNNFVFLAQDHYYDGVKFHRIIKDFIIQSGSRLSLGDNPANYGLGGPGYKFQNEVNWQSLHLDENTIQNLVNQGYKTDPNVTSVTFEKYSLAMANAGPDTNGSQFFIVTTEPDNENVLALVGKYTIFGKIIAGQDVVDKINNVELVDGNTDAPRPKNPVIVKTITISIN